eukprot:tig00000681_g3064.t1
MSARPAGLPVGTPYRFSLFDEPLVLWRADEDDQIRCVEDRCPHRAVPLSEGRVVPRSEGCGAGTLECGYHGWQFDGAGKCLRIPQLPAEVPINEARTCIKSYQVTVKQGLVWLWADAGSEGPEEAIPLSPTIARPDMEYVDVVRDLFAHYTVLVENVIDPTHVPFSHHSVQGNRYRAGPLSFTFEERPNGGFRGDMTMAGSMLAENALTFEPPTLGEYTFAFKMGQGGLIAYFIPTGHGRSRIIARFPRNFALWFMKLRPRWMDHFERNLILDQDLLFLREQEARLRRTGYEWRKEMYLPCEADAAVIRFRRWMDEVWPGMPGQTRGEDAARPLERQPESVLLDRYEQHVKICSSCSGALLGLRRAQRALEASACALVAFAALVGRVGPAPDTVLAAAPSLAAGAVGAALLCALALLPLREAEKRFGYFPRDVHKRPATRKELNMIRKPAGADAGAADPEGK